MPAKSLEQKGTLALHSARSLLIKQQTMLGNAIRGLGTEFGLTVPKGIGQIEELVELVDADKAAESTAAVHRIAPDAAIAPDPDPGVADPVMEADSAFGRIGFDVWSDVIEL